ncbi:rust resistance kinase Lr10-like isoform X2 [Fagus crenata]
MARGFPFTTAGLMALIALVLFHESCSSEDNQHCPPSSCGNNNISYPFRLRTDPITCGDLRYNLSCENNHTVLYLFERKYYVQVINYNNYTIRIVDSGIQKQNYYSTPAYSLNQYNFSFSTDSLVSAYSTYQLMRTKLDQFFMWYNEALTRSVVFMSCENPVNSPFYLDTSTCIGNDEYLYLSICSNNEDSSNTSMSHSKRYVVVGTTDAKDVEDSCTVDQTFLTSWPGNHDPNISCTDLHNELVYGFELSWLDGDSCYLDNANQVHCYFWDSVIEDIRFLVRTLLDLIGEAGGNENGKCPILEEISFFLFIKNLPSFPSRSVSAITINLIIYYNLIKSRLPISMADGQILHLSSSICLDKKVNNSGNHW